jgi:hypothetical protein
MLPAPINYQERGVIQSLEDLQKWQFGYYLGLETRGIRRGVNMQSQGLIRRIAMIGKNLSYSYHLIGPNGLNLYAAKANIRKAA